MKKKNVREVALDILLQIEKNQAYSNLLLNQTIKREKINEKDIGLLTEIVYGTIQRKNTLDYYLSQFVKIKLKKLDDWVLVLLRLSLYQIIYLDRVPERAVVHEAVELAKKKGHKGISAMVNGTLRSLLRQGVPSFNKIEDPIEKLAISYSHPIWLTKRWIDQFGEDKTKAVCEINCTPPMVTARVNKMKVRNIDEVIEKLEGEGVICERGDLSDDAIKVIKGTLPNTTAYKEGMVTIQDESSMLVARALGAMPKMKVLDSCAAPGGKTTHIAELMNNEGEICALDLHEHKVKLIDEQASRLNLSIIHTKATDSRKANEVFEKESFDCILVDAPCTGLGVIRRKPDIKWQKQEADIERITLIQKDILSAVAPLLKKGGTIVYSTCTIDDLENEEVVKSFLNEHSNFELDETLKERLPKKLEGLYNKGMVKILPSDFNTDGFFISSLKKI
ncbi:16S rRNA (cytosine(967)-C(5))-methyltransferase [Anaerobacillus arseniciselenatis]|uniref:16S rRNA (cytosine(967)-C(5))-methyltransferase n=1 Tax=Anaerobacillus arseniciselenatis TaxID=85682 RepID=A0A1S2LBI5_9BACI|nr:16S rRNA (cytosine(967)-C(5))-methyltransferase RsmB [Anaerobacillus arseniciselenatis]OIJ09852.1 16S rRNA (cytosine(967)-C(5))-methyltransferase [Anaerobacillus arseniciselenatis]